MVVEEIVEGEYRRVELDALYMSASLPIPVIFT
jgi:hypothetical protein